MERRLLDFDIRIRARNLSKGLVTTKDLEDHLHGLVDLSDHIELSELQQPALDDDSAQPETEDLEP